MTAPTPAVERAAHVIAEIQGGTGSSIFSGDIKHAIDVLTAALTDPDDPDALARTLFTASLVARDSGWTVEGSAMAWREDAEAAHDHWRRFADGLRILLVGSGA